MQFFILAAAVAYMGLFCNYLLFISSPFGVSGRHCLMMLALLLYFHLKVLLQTYYSTEFNGNSLSQHMTKVSISHRRPAKAQASLRISAVSPEPLLFADM